MPWYHLYISHIQMPIQKHSFTATEQSFDREAKKLGFQTGKLAVQADGSIVANLGENYLHCATVIARDASPDKDFLPLMIDWRDSNTAAGKI